MQKHMIGTSIINSILYSQIAFLSHHILDMLLSLLVKRDNKNVGLE